MAVNTSQIPWMAQSQFQTHLSTFPQRKKTKNNHLRKTLISPLSALDGLENDVKAMMIQKVRHTHHSYRNRQVVGSTNRWRWPAHLGSDLLGISQATKAVQIVCSESIQNVRTADNPRASLPESDDTSLFEMLSHPVPQRHRWTRSHTMPLVTNNVIARRQLRTAPANNAHLMSCSSEKVRTESFRSRSCQGEPYRYRTAEKYSNRNDDSTPTPLELFILRSQKASVVHSPDIVLHALERKWYLHVDNIMLSELLKMKFEDALEKPLYDATSCTASIGGSRMSPRLEAGVSLSVPCFPSSFIVKERLTPVHLHITDPNITTQAFATALLFFYEEEPALDVRRIIEIAAVASYLRMPVLKQRCSDVMIKSLRPETVSAYYETSTKYDLTDLTSACENWLILNLLPQLSHNVALAGIPQDLLERTLKSSRLFIPNEFSIYKLICAWIFLREQNETTEFPSWEMIVTWFIRTFSKAWSLLNNEDNHFYSSLFSAVRLNGITDTKQLNDIQKMAIFSEDKMLRLLNDHYFSLQGGGDMSLMTRFELGAVRYGFLLTEESTHFSRVITIHGFNFQLNATVRKNGMASVNFRRLKPVDPLLPFRVCDRQTFSMRQERGVRYSITAQWLDDHQLFVESIGPMTQSFGLGVKSAQSETLTVVLPESSLYVMISLYLPPS